MTNYVYFNNCTQSGKLGISTHCFDTIVSRALSRVEGISPSEKMKKKQFFYLHKPVSTTVAKGIVHVSVVVDVKKGVNLQDVSLKIQNEVTTAIELMTEQVPFDIQVKVAAII